MSAIGSIQSLPTRKSGFGQVLSLRPLPGLGDVQGDDRQSAAVSLRISRPKGALEDGSAPIARLNGSVITVIQQVPIVDIPAGTPGRKQVEIPGQNKEDETKDRLDDRFRPRRSSSDSSASGSRTIPGAPDILSTNEQDQIRRLRQRDAAVRAEEMSHKALAGPNAGHISYTYQKGPDGGLYAVGGSVGIRPLQGLKGMAAIANQAQISRAALIGTSIADRAVSDSAGAAIEKIFANRQQARAATSAYTAVQNRKI